MLNYLNGCYKKYKYLTYIFLCISCFSLSSQTLAEENNKNLQNVYKLLQEKNFKDALKELEVLCETNDVQAQLLFAKILFSGDLTPQDFETPNFCFILPNLYIIWAWTFIASKNVLFEIGKSLGSDVPACIESKDLKLKGYGDKVFRNKTPNGFYFLIINPNIHLSTKDIFVYF